METNRIYLDCMNEIEGAGPEDQEAMKVSPNENKQIIKKLIFQNKKACIGIIKSTSCYCCWIKSILNVFFLFFIFNRFFFFFFKKKITLH